MTRTVHLQRLWRTLSRFVRGNGEIISLRWPTTPPGLCCFFIYSTVLGSCCVYIKLFWGVGFALQSWHHTMLLSHIQRSLKNTSFGAIISIFRRWKFFGLKIIYKHVFTLSIHLIDNQNLWVVSLDPSLSWDKRKT